MSSTNENLSQAIDAVAEGYKGVLVYGGDGTVPLDKWFGSWHDGTPESHEIMRVRRKKAHGA